MITIIVPGRPVTVNATDPVRRRDWAAQVAAAAQPIFPAPLMGDDLTITVTFWYNRLPDFDTDNASKPICDALQGIAYLNDRQLAERHARRRDLNGAYTIKGVDPLILTAISQGDEFVCIVIDRLGQQGVQV
jgi:Endodeoxyribonuclease RusA